MLWPEATAAGPWVQAGGQRRWIGKFEQPRLEALSAVKRRAEDDMSDRPAFVYTTYIEATPERVWQALTDPDLTAAYRGHPTSRIGWTRRRAGRRCWPT